MKRANTRVNKRIKFPRDTKQRIQEIAMNNSCKTQIVQILREIRYEDFLSKGKFLSRISIPVELTHEWIKANFMYQEPYFTIIFLMS